MHSLIFLLRHVPRLYRFVQTTFPAVDAALAEWQQLANRTLGPRLAEQALASLHDKRFHCLGGAIYALSPQPTPLPFIVALQTISDYLDNLCDRVSLSDEAAFRQLHRSLCAAVDLSVSPTDYYADYPLQDDQGYLAALVAVCRNHVASLPHYRTVQPQLQQLAGLYSDLQTYKHLDAASREAKLIDWLQPLQAVYPDLSWWELAAATGSTLGLFVLSSRPAAGPPAQLAAAYFPWISGLHILLDYFIDAAEDRQSGDLNFVSYYPSAAVAEERLQFFATKAWQAAAQLPEAPFHQLVVSGLLALYLSDPKAATNANRPCRDILLATAAPATRHLYRLCCWLRRRRRLG